MGGSTRSGGERAAVAPDPLAADGQPTTWHSKQFNISCRFCVLQPDKFRACDDLKHSMTHLACSVHTPIQLVSRGHIACLSQLLSRDGGDWVLVKADHEAAYKQPPIDPRDRRHAIASLRNPLTHTWQGCVARTWICGSVAAVLRYNGVPPLVGYFDDFAALVRKLMGEDALRVFARACQLLGIALKPGKSEVGSEITFPGLLGNFPSRGNKNRLLISLHREKRKLRSDLLEGFIRE